VGAKEQSGRTLVFSLPGSRDKYLILSLINVSKISTFHPFPVGEAPFSQKRQKFVFYNTHIDLLYKYFFAHISTAC
jgi:hypothetical protein